MSWSAPAGFCVISPKLFQASDKSNQGLAQPQTRNTKDEKHQQNIADFVYLARHYIPTVLHFVQIFPFEFFFLASDGIRRITFLETIQQNTRAPCDDNANSTAQRAIPRPGEISLCRNVPKRQEPDDKLPQLDLSVSYVWRRIRDRTSQL